MQATRRCLHSVTVNPLRRSGSSCDRQREHEHRTRPAVLRPGAHQVPAVRPRRLPRDRQPQPGAPAATPPAAPPPRLVEPHHPPEHPLPPPPPPPPPPPAP